MPNYPLLTIEVTVSADKGQAQGQGQEGGQTALAVAQLSQLETGPATTQSGNEAGPVGGNEAATTTTPAQSEGLRPGQNVGRGSRTRARGQGRAITASATPGKTRSFSAPLIGYVQADRLWSGGSGAGSANTIRPVWLRVGGSEQELKAFVANLQSGYRASFQSGPASQRQHIELLKSVGYRYVWQREELDGRAVAVVTVYLPALAQLDPGMVDPARAAFVLLPPRWWVEQEMVGLLEQPQVLAPVFEHARRLGLLKSGASIEDLTSKANRVTTQAAAGKGSAASKSQSKTKSQSQAKSNSAQPKRQRRYYWAHHRLSAQELVEWLPVAAYFAAYLDRRTTRPLLDELPFYVQLLFCALREGIAGLPQPRPGDYTYREDQDKWRWAKRLNASFYEFGAGEGGIYPQPVVCLVRQNVLDTFLAAQARVYLGLKQSWPLAEIVRAEAQIMAQSKTPAQAQNNAVSQSGPGLGQEKSQEATAAA